MGVMYENGRHNRIEAWNGAIYSDLTMTNAAG